MTHRIKRIVFILIVLLLMLGNGNKVEAEKVKIRVGFPSLEGLQELSSYGEYYGYNYEYLQEIAREENWDLSFVVDSWTNCMDMLKSGDIDVMGFITRTDEMAANYDLCELEAGVCSTTIFAQENNTSLNYGEYSGLNGRTIGILSGNELEVDFDQFLQDNGISMQKVYYDNQVQMNDALASGAVETMLGTNFRYTNQKKLVAQFTPRRFYFATTKGNRTVLRGLNHAMERITMMYPQYNQGLYNTFYGNEYAKILSLTVEEKRFVKESPTIRVIYDPNNQPIEYTSHATGQFEGAMKSVYEDIAKYTGLDFTFIPVDTYQEEVKMIMNGEADLVCSFERNAQWEQNLGINTTYMLFSTNIETITRKTKKTDGSLAMLKRYVPVQTRKLYESTNTVHYYDTAKECLKAVADGTVAETLLNHYSFNQYQDEYKYKELVAGETLQKVQFGIGVSGQANHLLYSILNKAVVSLDTSTINDYLVRAGAQAKPITLLRWINENSSVAFIIIVISLIGILLNMVYVKRERRRNARLLAFNQRTNIWNEEKFLQEARISIQQNRSTSMLMVVTDIARFRFVNDAFGYETGDKILRLFAQSVRRMMMYDGELYGSIGADHFLALMKYESEDVIKLRFKTMVNDFQQEVFKICDFRFVIRTGLVIIDSSNRDKDIYELFQNANHARAMITNPYKSEYRFYDEELARSIEELRVLDKDMVQAFRDQKFVPYYQLKYNIFTNEIVGAEALVRWVHEEQGILPPSEFLPYFERSGFIVDIDFYILEKTCEMLADWIAKDIPVFPISCNFSRLHFTDDMFPYHVQQITEKYKVPNRLIEVEITETVAMENLKQIIEQIRSLKLMRFRISIDDFGSGYSSLGVLQSLDVDVIKLDRSFLSEKVDNKRNHAVLAAITDLATKLGIHVICEGVETPDQVALLKEIHCEDAQGYYYARPVPGEDLVRRVIKEQKEKG